MQTGRTSNKDFDKAAARPKGTGLVARVQAALAACLVRPAAGRHAQIDGACRRSTAGQELASNGRRLIWQQ